MTPTTHVFLLHVDCRHRHHLAAVMVVAAVYNGFSKAQAVQEPRLEDSYKDHKTAYCFLLLGCRCRLTTGCA